jgi:hypothetical protein
MRRRRLTMTSNKQLTLAIGMIISFLSLSVYAQSDEPKRNHFSTDGISFDYPAGYSVSDESTTEAQQFIITRKGSSVELTVVRLRRMVLPGELPAAVEHITDPMINKVALTLGQTNSLERTPIQTSVGPKQAEGIQLQSSGNRNGSSTQPRIKAFTQRRKGCAKPFALTLRLCVKQLQKESNAEGNPLSA